MTSYVSGSWSNKSSHEASTFGSAPGLHVQPHCGFGPLERRWGRSAWSSSCEGGIQGSPGADPSVEPPKAQNLSTLNLLEGGKDWVGTKSVLESEVGASRSVQASEALPAPPTVQQPPIYPWMTKLHMSHGNVVPVLVLKSIYLPHFHPLHVFVVAYFPFNSIHCFSFSFPFSFIDRVRK